MTSDTLTTQVHPAYPMTDQSVFVVGAVGHPTVAYFDDGPAAARFQRWLAGHGYTTWSDPVA